MIAGVGQEVVKQDTEMEFKVSIHSIHIKTQLISYLSTLAYSLWLIFPATVILIIVLMMCSIIGG